MTPPLPAFDAIPPHRAQTPRRALAGRIAWIASGLLHLLLLAGFWQFGETRAQRIVPDVTTAAATDERPIVLAFSDEPEPTTVTVAVPEPPAEPPPPAVVAVKPSPAPVAEVVEVVGEVALAQFAAPPAPRYEPAAPAVVPAPPASPPRFAEGKALHGPLPDGRRAVYLLDRSASMGLVRETFEASRAALFASAGGTKAGAEFQALAYHSDVNALLGDPRTAWLKMDAEVPARLRKALASLEPEGRSRHDLALRTALLLEPDYVVWITDADEAELAAVRPILRGVRKPVAVYLCKAGGGKVEPPVEWK